MIQVGIVEDIETIRQRLCNQIDRLAGQEMRCSGAYASGEEALGGILLKRPDIVIMDIGLPAMSGIECMFRLKTNKLANTKFIMFTIFEDDEQVFESLKAGADGYILKREPVPKIIQAIREVYAGGAPMSPSIARKVLESFRKTEKQNQLIEILSPRQHEILEQLSKGYFYKEIAADLDITLGTLKQHIHQIYKKLQVNNRTEAINKYLDRG